MQKNINPKNHRQAKKLPNFLYFKSLLKPLLCGALFIGIVFCVTINYALSGEAYKMDIPLGYQFELDDEQKSKLLEGVAAIKTGDSILSVKVKLGTPTVEKDLFGKKGEFKFSVLEYYVARVDLKNTNTNDKLISLYFDKGGHLVQIDNFLGSNLIK